MLGKALWMEGREKAREGEGEVKPPEQKF